jgi:membrane peptidoglycan carboxypeptidase
VTESLRQPGSAMKPIVYLAAFRSGDFTLETLVPDEPISVPDGRGHREVDLELRRPLQGIDSRSVRRSPNREMRSPSG